jgi:hypothetical protein
MSATILILPGYGDSGPGHWQTIWEERNGWTRVVQDDWERPTLDAWKERLADAMADADGPVVLVAHSLACALVAHVAGDPLAERIAGAFLVAPPDVDEVRHLLPEIETFAPMPLRRLPFPAVVVSSTNDPYAEPVRARGFAEAWGARLVELDGVGHVNVESGHGEWPEGRRLLDELLETIRR